MGQSPSKAEVKAEALRPPHPTQANKTQANKPPLPESPVPDRPSTPTINESETRSTQESHTKNHEPDPRGSLNSGSNLDIPTPGVSFSGHISPDENTVAVSEKEPQSSSVTGSEKEPQASSVAGPERETRASSVAEPEKEPHASSIQSSDVKSQHTDRQLPFKQRSFHGRNSLKITSDPLAEILKEATRGPLTSYPREEVFSPQASINEPYHLIFYHWEKIESHAHEDAKALLSFVKESCPDTFEKFQELQMGTCTNIPFEDLWLLYRPRATILKRDDSGWRAYKVEKVEFQSNLSADAMLIYAHYLDFDSSGRWLVPHLEVLTVPSYSGERAIGNLEVVPEWYFQKYPNKNLLKSLVERGKTYESYRSKVSYQDYNGDAWSRTPRKEPVRVIVDYVTSSKHIPDTKSLAQSYNRLLCPICLGNDIKLTSFPNDAPHDPDLCTRSPPGISDSANDCDNEDGSPWLYCPPGIWAFSLRHKSWQQVLPQDLSAVPDREKAFERLWMDSGLRHDLGIMVAAYKNHKLNNVNPDIIDGKGHSLNILLRGGPGTGKGMTVEILSEKHGCPLYTITGGELGAEPELFEERLHEIFLRASNWRVILLLRDVDMFLEARDPYDRRRNMLVSIFLRHLEYSHGFLFMTTSRPKRLDIALESHIHMSIQFHGFDIVAQKSIWINFIQEVEGLSNKQKKQLESFVKGGSLEQCGWTNMNGRQIRNCMNAALALAQAEGRELSPEHIKKMLLLGKESTGFMFQPPTTLAAKIVRSIV